MKPSLHLPKEDLDHILRHVGSSWEELRGGKIFITGGTGFFGHWLLESFVSANDHLHLQAEAVVLTRDSENFRKQAPHLAGHPAVKLHIGDVRNFVFPKGRFVHVIHAATDASAKLNAENPLLMLDTIVEGTRRVLDFAVKAGVEKFLFTSSGAVYGTQPSEISNISEEYSRAPETGNVRSAYGEGKRMSELLCAAYAGQHHLEIKIARCFAFVGPYLPLDAHFAIGNFIRDALEGRTIEVVGDGTPLRSYLYAGDLSVWLWTILFRGLNKRTYNVGSEVSMSIAEIAQMVAKCFEPPVHVQIAQMPDLSRPVQRYVPSTARARSELGLSQKIDLCNALTKTINWHKKSADRG